nr:unnamed protein product [Digitaria exilis]
MASTSTVIPSFASNGFLGTPTSISANRYSFDARISDSCGAGGAARRRGTPALCSGGAKVDVVQLEPGVEGRAEVAVRHRLGVVGSGGATRALGVAAVVSVVVDEAVEYLRSVLGTRVAGKPRSGVLQVEGLLQLGDGLEELRLKSGEERQREIGVGSGGGGAEDDAEGRKLGSDPRNAEIHAARLGDSSKRLEASDDISWSSDCARGSGGRSGSSDGEVVRVGAAPEPAAALAGRLPCGGEEVGFNGDGLGVRDGDEAVSPNLAGEGT